MNLAKTQAPLDLSMVEKLYSDLVCVTTIGGCVFRASASAGALLFLYNMKGKKMTEIFEKLWENYFYNELSDLHSDEEKAAAREVRKTREKMESLLSDEQMEAVGEYVEAMQEEETFFAKRAFIKGCELGASFILDTGISK